MALMDISENEARVIRKLLRKSPIKKHHAIAEKIWAIARNEWNIEQGLMRRRALALAQERERC